MDKKELKKCKICGNSESSIYLHEDGVCTNCKYVPCKNCGKKRLEYNLKDGMCNGCYKNAEKENKAFHNKAQEENRKLENSYKICPFCHEKIKFLAIKCRFCNEMVNKDNNTVFASIKNYGTTKYNVNEQAVTAGHDKNLLDIDTKLVGIRGWLTVMGLGLILSPILILFTIIVSWDDYFMYEIILNAILAISYGYVFYLMIKRKKIFINYCIYLFILRIVVAIICYVVTKYIFSSYEATPEMTTALLKLGGDIFEAFLFGLVWSLYLLKSKRVKLTFIE